MILVGHVIEQLATVREKSVHCCVTSPPYWGLRAYGTSPQVWPSGWVGEYGSEPTIDLYVENTLAVFRAVRRVLRDDGLLWLNLGDCYAGSWGSMSHSLEGNAKPYGTNELPAASRPQNGLKSGDLCNIPYRVAMALQADGWYWRQTIVWNKPAPMPESVNGWSWQKCRIKTANGKHGKYAPRMTIETVTPASFKDDDRLAKWADCPGCEKCQANGGLILSRGRWRATNSWEPVFLFAKSEIYFCDAERVKEETTGGAHPRGNGLNPKAIDREVGKEKQNGDWSEAVTELVEKRNPRSVWTISAEPYNEAHFATFPGMLPYRCIQASTSPAGCCATCGNQFAPIVERQRIPTRPGETNQVDPSGKSNRDPQRHIQVSKVLGYRPTCHCPEAPAARPVVLDPFLGSGTTAAVAEYLQCDWIGCELNPAYAELAEQRRAAGWQPRHEKNPSKKPRKRVAAQLEMFS